MTPKEKAGELFNKYHKACNATIAGAYTLFLQIAKKCTIVCVDEILNEQVRTDYLTDTAYNEQKGYWQQVKTEIENL